MTCADTSVIMRPPSQAGGKEGRREKERLEEEERDGEEKEEGEVGLLSLTAGGRMCPDSSVLCMRSALHGNYDSS